MKNLDEIREIVRQRGNVLSEKYDIAVAGIYTISSFRSILAQPESEFLSFHYHFKRPFH